jgi:phospholipid transport system substrate-binding protein
MAYLFQKTVAVLVLTVSGILACIQPAIAADDPAAVPQALVEKVAGELFVVAKANVGAKATSEEYYAKVEEILERVVDFPYIARVVMGKKAGSEATPEQIKQFAEVFKDGLVRSYAKGIAAYADSEMKFLPADVNPQRPDAVVVRQEVMDQGNVHHLAYSMRQNKKTKEWKLLNVTLNGVNLGESFRSQFNQAYIKQSGDIDKVINTWLSEA